MDDRQHPCTAFKILTAAQWAQFEADGLFKGAPVDLADGYIHLSIADQVQGTLDKHFMGQDGLVIAEVDLPPLQSPDQMGGVPRGRVVPAYLRRLAYDRNHWVCAADQSRIELAAL